MKCPRDGAALAKVKMLGVDLDKCHGCDGLWCDRGELEHVHDSAEAGVEAAIERIYGNPAVARGDVKAYMGCPRCPDGRLQSFVYTFTAAVKLDRCERCLGVWLDAGELDAAVRQQQELGGGPVQARDGHLRGILRAVRRALTS